jgi:DNA-binding NtrC family response regulator
MILRSMYADLPEVFRFSASTAKRLDRRLEDVERDYILDVYAGNKGHLSRTAEKPGIDRKTLRERMKRNGNR